MGDLQRSNSREMMEFEAQMRCCICLDIYMDPVSLPCAHNFCLDCIEGYWDTKNRPDCPLCKQVFSSRPKLNVNRDFANIVAFFRKSGHDETTPPETGREEANNAACIVCRGKEREKRCSACQKKKRAGDLCEIHLKPLTVFCRKDRTLLCTRCSEKNHKHHNTVLLEKEQRRLKAKLRMTKTNIQEMIQTREGKMEEIQRSVEESKTHTEMEIQRSSEICSVLVKSIQRQQASLIQELETNQRQAETGAQQLLAELEEEIRQLHAKEEELQALEASQSSAHILELHRSLAELPPSREWSQVPMHPELSMGTVRKAFSKLAHICQELTNRLSAEDTDKMSRHAVSVTLDPQTASGWLVVSSDGKKVCCQKKKTALPDVPQRFDSCVCVLGKQRFTSDRHYWVVQVGDKTDWDVGVACESINRKGTITVRPETGFWAICRRGGRNLSACESPAVAIHLQDTPTKIGVFLDYEAGSVSFVNAETKTHIYTFSGCTFGELLHPYFNPCVQNNGTNEAPLVICPLIPEQSVTINTGVSSP